MVLIYEYAFKMPVEKLRQWAIVRLAGARGEEAVAALVRILDRDPKMYAYGWNVVSALAKGALVDKRLAEKLLLLYRKKAEDNYRLTLYNVVLTLDVFVNAVVKCCGPEPAAVVAPMAMDRNPVIRGLAFKIFEATKDPAGLKPGLAVAGAIHRQGHWDDEAFAALKAIVNAHGVSALRRALRALMTELNLSDFVGCMDVAGRLINWVPLTLEVLDLACELPYDEVSGVFVSALAGRDEAIRARAAEFLLGQLPLDGEMRDLVDRMRRGEPVTEESRNRLNRDLSKLRPKAGTMIEQEQSRKNAERSGLAWTGYTGEEARKIASDGGLRWSAREKQTIVLLSAPAGMVYEGGLEFLARVHGTEVRARCDELRSSNWRTTPAIDALCGMMLPNALRGVCGRRTDDHGVRRVHRPNRRGRSECGDSEHR